LYVDKSYVRLSCVNNVKTDLNLSYIERFSSYLGMNTHRLGYKSQPVNVV